jgi:hypothetical protein
MPEVLPQGGSIPFLHLLKLWVFLGLTWWATEGLAAERRLGAGPSNEPSLHFPIVSEQPAEAHGALIAEARFIDGERTLLTIDHREEVKLWDVATGTLKASHRFGPNNYVNNISVSPDEQLLAIACKGGRMIVLQLATGKIAWELSIPTGCLDADFHPEGKSVLVSDDANLVAYDRITGKPVKRFARQAVKQWALTAEFLSRERFVTISQKGDLTIWNWATGLPEPRILSGFLRDNSARWQIVEQPDPLVLIAQFGGPMVAVDLGTGTAHALADGDGRWRIALDWDLARPQKKVLTSQAVFDFPSGESVARTGINGFEKVCVSPSGKYLAALSLRGWRVYHLPKSLERPTKHQATP